MNENISTASENYLEVIYELSRQGPVRSVDVATRMRVSKASVNKAVGVLRQAGLVDHQLYGTIALTPKGYERGRKVDRRHRILRKFLVEVLLVDERTADEDACEMEHVVSETTMLRLIDYLQNAHGDSTDEENK